MSNTSNIDYFLHNAVSGQECQIYKSCANYDEPSGDKVCYIGQYGLEDLITYKEKGKDLTDEQIVSRGIGESRNSILKAVREEAESQGFHPTEGQVANIAEILFEKADWAYFSTYIEEFAQEDEFEEYCD